MSPSIAVNRAQRQSLRLKDNASSAHIAAAWKRSAKAGRTSERRRPACFRQKLTQCATHRVARESANRGSVWGRATAPPLVIDRMIWLYDAVIAQNEQHRSWLD